MIGSGVVTVIVFMLIVMVNAVGHRIPRSRALSVQHLDEFLRLSLGIRTVVVKKRSPVFHGALTVVRTQLEDTNVCFWGHLARRRTRDETRQGTDEGGVWTGGLQLTGSDAPTVRRYRGGSPRSPPVCIRDPHRRASRLRMDDPPCSVDPPEEIGPVTLVMDVPPVAGGELDIRIDHGPRKVPFEMCLDVRKSKTQAQLRLRFDVMLDQVTEPEVFTAPLEVAGSLPIEEVTVERSTVSLLPTEPDVLQDFFKESRVVRGEIRFPDGGIGLGDSASAHSDDGQDRSGKTSSHEDTPMEEFIDQMDGRHMISAGSARRQRVASG